MDELMRAARSPLRNDYELPSWRCKSPFRYRLEIRFKQIINMVSASPHFRGGPGDFAQISEGWA